MTKHLIITLALSLIHGLVLAQTSPREDETVWPEILPSTWELNNGYAFAFYYSQDSLESDFADFKGFISNMGSADTLHISYRSSGCFHQHMMDLMITKPYHYFVEQDGETSLLSSEGLNIILGLEQAITQVYVSDKTKKAICTSSSTLKMSLNNQVMRFYDQSCDWNGWDAFNAHRVRKIKSRHRL